MEEAALESPCVRDCRIDQVTGYCVGCLRTLREISYWERYSPAERRRVMAMIETRRIVEASRLPGN
ncbi:MAG TPA: DUF1289 domain-containing protein [Burkholderiales bacterium]|nr:DUF1289 domain-containing protein [Burkholderiales bacterium]